MIAPPGAGKGTQGALIAAHFDIPHIATGDLLRDHRARGTELGIQASQYISSGRLVPDDLVVAMVHERIASNPRFLLDGFPRTLAQAHALAHVLNLTRRKLTAAIFVDAPDQVVIDRIAGRADGRDDDQPDIVRQRLELFHRSTAPVLAYYQQLGLLQRLDAARPVSDVYADARRLLQAISGPVNGSSTAFAPARRPYHELQPTVSASENQR
jgi:adenylate kinase